MSHTRAGYQPPETCVAKWIASNTAGTLNSLRT
jgi:hypothetical protein